MKRYNRGVFLLGSCRSCLQAHGNEALPKVSEALDCSSNTTLRVEEQMGDLVATFIPNNSRHCGDTAFLSLTDTDQEQSNVKQYEEPSPPGWLWGQRRASAVFSHCAAGWMDSISVTCSLPP